MENDALMFPGSSNPDLAISLQRDFGVHLGRVDIGGFANGEIRLQVVEQVQGRRVFVLQSTYFPTGERIIELGLLADAIKRECPERIYAVIPWFGYSAQDKVFRPGEPLSSQVVIRMLESTPIDEFVLCDVHSELVLGYFSKPVHHISALPIFLEYFRGKMDNTWSVVSLDTGDRGRAEVFCRELGCGIIYLDKDRDKVTGEVTLTYREGEVQGRTVISFDDFVSTGRTRIKACQMLKGMGAERYIDCVTHFIVPDTIARIEGSPIDEMYTTDSIPLQLSPASKIHVLSLAPLVAAEIRRLTGVGR